MPTPNQSQISMVLAELGWNEAHAIPKTRMEQLKHHMKNVQQEIDYTNSLCNLRDKEINEELHQIKLTEREYQRLIQENKKIAKIHYDITEKKSFLETLFYQKRKELENSSNIIDSDKNSLENLMKTIGESDEDMKIIEKYIKQDNTKIKELDLEVEKLTQIRNELNSKLDTIYTNTLVNQIALDNLSKDVKHAYKQRDELIKQWESRLNQVKSEVCEQKQLNKEKLNFLQTNSDVKRHLNEIITNITQSKQELIDTEMKRQDFHSELEALKRTVDKAVSDLEAARALSSQLKKEKETKLQNLEKVKETVENSLTRLAYVTECKLTAEQYADEADKQLLSQELNHELFCKQMNKLRDEKFKINQKYEELVHSEKLLKQTISGGETTKRNLIEKIEMLDSQLLKQQEVLYRQDFTVQSLERRIGKMSGEQSVEQRELMENKINELTKELNERVNTVNLLTNQLGNLGREVHRVKREHESLLQKNATFTNQLNTNELEMDIMLKEKEKSSMNLKKLLVEKNLKKLEAYNLQKSSQELNSIIKERTEQINLHHTMLNKQIKLNTTENSQLNIEIQERKSKVDKLIKRYEIITSLMAPPDGEETKNQAYYIIRIVALKNTLALMNGCNTVYRMSHSQLSNDAEEIQQQEELNEQIRVLSIKSRYDNARLKELQQLYNTMEESSTRLNKDIELYTDQTKRLEIEVQYKMNEIEKQTTRLNRAFERMEKAKHLVKENEQNEMEPDIEARLAKELVMYSTNELLNRIKCDMTIYEQARVMLSASGLPINNLFGVSGQQRRVSGLSLSTKSHTSSNRTTPTPIGSNLTSPDSTKCSSKVSTPRNDSVCGDGVECEDVENSSRITSGNSLKDIPLSTTSIDLLQQTQLPSLSKSTKSSSSSEKLSKSNCDEIDIVIIDHVSNES
ncbi:Coiled-coil domain-containing protein [Schistosoma japonicum]|nr:Coiled-coil domain-containing protein [Schistosoma japonicum]